MVPGKTAQGLMAKYTSVRDGAWQACATALALIHAGAEVGTTDFNKLQGLFRCGTPPHTADHNFECQVQLLSAL